MPAGRLRVLVEELELLARELLARARMTKVRQELEGQGDVLELLARARMTVLVVELEPLARELLARARMTKVTPSSTQGGQVELRKTRWT